MSRDTVIFTLGMVVTPACIALGLVALWLTERGRRTSCDLHEWSTGTTNTPRIVRLTRYWAHVLRYPRYHRLFRRTPSERR